jgi:hypothetical protein
MTKLQGLSWFHRGHHEVSEAEGYKLQTNLKLQLPITKRLNIEIYLLNIVWCLPCPEEHRESGFLGYWLFPLYLKNIHLVYAFYVFVYALFTSLMLLFK